MSRSIVGNVEKPQQAHGAHGSGCGISFRNPVLQFGFPFPLAVARWVVNGDGRGGKIECVNTDDSTNQGTWTSRLNRV